MEKLRRPFVLMIAVASLYPASPLLAQDGANNTGSKMPVQQSPVVKQMADDFKNYDANYIGVATAKDAYGTENLWEWYWDKKAHINITRGYFWGDDAISQGFQSVSDKYVVPFWNVVMESEIVRIMVLLVLAGIPIGWGVRLSGAFPKMKDSENNP